MCWATAMSDIPPANSQSTASWLTLLGIQPMWMDYKTNNSSAPHTHWELISTTKQATATAAAYTPVTGNHFHLSTVTGWRTHSLCHWRSCEDTLTLRTCVCWTWPGIPMSPSSLPQGLTPPFACGTEEARQYYSPVGRMTWKSLGVWRLWRLWLHKHWSCCVRVREGTREEVGLDEVKEECHVQTSEHRQHMVDLMEREECG